MLVDLKRVIAYICPFCSNLSTRKLSVFNFSGGADIKLICPVNGCHEECAGIHQGKDKYTIEIECPVCGETHTHIIKPLSFWKKRLVVYKCSETNVDIFFIGEHDAVEEALKKNAGMYDDLNDEFDDRMSNEQRELIDKIIARVRDLYKSECISCSCGSDQVSAAVYNNKLALSCHKCHKTRYIEFSEETLKMLDDAGTIVI